MEELEIIYRGHAMFGLNTKNTSLITDPYNEKIKDKLPDVSSDIVTVSHDHYDHSNTGIIKGDPEIIKNTRERYIGDFRISGINSYHDPQQGRLRGKNIIFIIEASGIKIIHLGDLGHIPDDSTLESLSGTDILLIPVGGIYTLDAREAFELADKIAPKVIIPMHYKEPDSKLEVDNVESFLGLFEGFEKKPHSVRISAPGLPARQEIWVMESK